jgi:hypothetical protein
MGFELRALVLLGRNSISWATPAALFVLGIFEIGSHKLFIWGWLQTLILLISASWIARITDLSHWHPPFLCAEDGTQGFMHATQALLTLSCIPRPTIWFLHFLTKVVFKNLISCWFLVAQASYPSYSGNKDQDNQGLKPARANSSRGPILQKKGW